MLQSSTVRRLLAVLALVVGCGKGSSGEPAPIHPIQVSLPTGRIVLYGDSRPANPGEEFFMGRPDPVQERALIIRQIASEKPDLIVHSGDLVGRGSSEGQWLRWDETHQPILGAKIPFHVSPGNHEYAGDSTEGLRYFHQRFPSRGGWKWIAVRAGPIQFVLVDTNFDSLSTAEVSSQDAWFQKTLKDAAADAGIKAVVVVSHHPPYTNSKVHGPSEETRRRFANTATTCPKFKLYVAGHVHNYERFLIGGVHYVVSGGGGAPATGVRTSDFRTTPEFHGPEYRPFHYLMMTVGTDRATVDTFMLQDDATWKSGDRFEIPW